MRHAIHECPLCGLKFTHPQPTPQDAERIYRDNGYFTNKRFFDGDDHSLFGYADYFAESPVRKRRFAAIAKRCKKEVERSFPRSEGPPLLLEVGCGPGLFLREAQKAGFHVHGVERNPAIIPRSPSRGGLSIAHEDFEEFSEKDSPAYHCIVLLDTLEHFARPDLVIAKCRRLLHPGGVLVIGTVDSGSIISRLLGRRLEDFRRVREHCFLFGRKSLRTLLQRHSLHVFRLRSMGHTLPVGHILLRTAIMFPALEGPAHMFVRAFPEFSSRRVHVNPFTKMIAYARKPLNPQCIFFDTNQWNPSA